MKFICPKCHIKLNIPEERVPAAGAWARCPKCQERFYLRVKQAFDPSAEAAAPAAAGPVRRGAEARQLIDRLRAKQGRAETSLEGPEGGWGVVVFPQEAHDLRIYGVLVALLVAAFLALLAGIFRAAGARPTPWEEAERPVAREYDQAGVRSDLASMKADLVRRNAVSRDIEYSGPETRAFKYLLARLAPEACREISGLHLWAPRTIDGFRAVGVCLDGGGATPELEINWSVEPVLASLAGSKDRLELPLSSSAVAETESGEERDE